MDLEAELIEISERQQFENYEPLQEGNVEAVRAAIAREVAPAWQRASRLMFGVATADDLLAMMGKTS